MPKLVINDKSGKKNTSMNFFLDDEVIKFKENKKEIENVDYGEHTIKARTLYFKSSEQKINIEKEVTEIEIKQNYNEFEIIKREDSLGNELEIVIIKDKKNKKLLFN